MTLCIYHGNCADGFGAAWALRQAIPEAEFYPATYQEPPPDVSERRVIMVDFSYKRLMLLDMADKAETILILDHHKSSKEDLIDLPANVVAVFDMERSGAMMTWQHLFPGVPPPRLLEHIQDRDLWRFALPGTREIMANVFSYPYDFDVWDMLMATDVETMRVGGEAIERKHHKDIADLVKITRIRMIIGGFDVPVANIPHMMSSDAGHLMAQGEPFAACYWDTPDGRVFSLRSSNEGQDVSAIAKQYGGGGHRNAAGFKVPHGHVLGPNRAQDMQVLARAL